MDSSTEMLKPGDMVISPNDDKYELLPDGEPLQAHISEVGLRTVPNKFKETDSDPDEVNKLVVKVKIDEDIPGQGQVYTGWYTPSLNEKSKLRPLIVAALGEVREFDPTELVGKMVRVVLVNKPKDGVDRQFPDSFLKPAKDQKIAEVKKTTDDVQDMSKEEFDNLFAND